MSAKGPSVVYILDSGVDVRAHLARRCAFPRGWRRYREGARCGRRAGIFRRRRATPGVVPGLFPLPFRSRGCARVQFGTMVGLAPVVQSAWSCPVVIVIVVIAVVVVVVVVVAAERVGGWMGDGDGDGEEEEKKEDDDEGAAPTSRTMWDAASVSKKSAVIDSKGSRTLVAASVATPSRTKAAETLPSPPHGRSPPVDPLSAALVRCPSPHPFTARTLPVSSSRAGPT